jgi:hypothetical protein
VEESRERWRREAAVEGDGVMAERGKGRAGGEVSRGDGVHAVGDGAAPVPGDHAGWRWTQGATG